MKTNRISHLPAAEIEAEFTRQSDANAALKSENTQLYPNHLKIPASELSQSFEAPVGRGLTGSMLS